MKLFYLNLIVTLALSASFQCFSQATDTLIDAGGYRLHFNIIKGKGIPILFEAGFGDAGSVWNNILTPVAKITGTTLIAYDREGLGQSEINKKETREEAHGIINGIEALETALKKLGYDKDIILVAHSYGGFYATLYASRHPNLVKSVIYMDVRHAHCVSDDFLKNLKPPERIKENLGIYYPAYNYVRTVTLMRQIQLPADIPTIDMVSEIPFEPEPEFPAYWKDCHQQFNRIHPKNEPITALGCGHYIFLENPLLAVSTIVKAYCSRVNENERKGVLERNLEHTPALANDLKKQEADFKHSAEDIDAWGYTFMQQSELKKALEVFKLNVFLHPLNWMVYDSYGEALLKNGQKEEAIKMYRRSVELNPENENGKNVLKEMYGE